MKNEFIYRNPIFIAEVKQRLADKRNFKLKSKLIMIDKLPIEKEESKKNSLLLSRNNSQNNLKYFMNFIKEKGYKANFSKIKSIIHKKLIKNKSFNIKREKKERNNLPNIIKLFNSQNNDNNIFYKINIRNNCFNNQRQTPFQINHIKNYFLKQYIQFSKKRNSHNFIKDEKSIESFSVNKNGEKIKIFGENKYTIRNISENKTLKIGKNYRTNYISRDYILKKGFRTVKPNCYYNRINLRKYCLKSELNNEKNAEN